MKYAIRTQDLSCYFGSIKAVDRLTLEVPKGIIFGFLGPNGSGKTTTIQLLLGLLETRQGTAEVLGFDIQTQSDQIRSRSGALLEHTGLYERLSALENLELFGRINRLDPHHRQIRIHELLTHFGLWERRGDRVKEWSKGMKQKLAISRALLHSPELLFLDEPTAGLDPVAAAVLCTDIASLVEQEGVTVFLNTHNLPEAEKLCAQVGLIRSGRLLTVGSPDQLRTGKDLTLLVINGTGFTPEIIERIHTLQLVDSVSKENNQLKIRLMEDTRPSDLVSYLVNAGVQVDEVSRSRTNLEDVFLKLIEEDANVN